MIATQKQLLQFLETARQFTIPIYQRVYSWTEAECDQLWEDIMRVGAREDSEGINHFFGSITYILFNPEMDSSSRVIDGQQRLTTVSLILEALARQIGDSEPVEGFSANKIRNRYLRDPNETGENSYKLILTQTDKQTMLAIVGGRELPSERSLRLEENFNFFREKVEKLNSNVETLCRGLRRLQIVSVALESGRDDPQLIFESMNSTGRKLSQADLIRNFILMDLEQGEQEMLYNEHWRPMEVAFGQKAYDKHFDGFMRHYLTAKSEKGEIPRIGDVYEEFKTLARQHIKTGGAIDSLVAEVHTYARHYCAMALGKEPDHGLNVAFDDLRDLKADVVYPLLLVLYHDYYEERLSKEDLVKAVRLVESYIFRRAVCAIPTNSLNKTFAGFGKALKKDRYLESIQAHFQGLMTYRKFPRDEEFLDHLKERDLYNFGYRAYWLRRLENHGKKERVRKGEYSIEHIMPQDEKLSKKWRDELGSDWQRIHGEALHKLGNLTLTAYNPEYSNRPFAEKRDMENGFKESPLFVNRGLGTVPKWDEAAMQARANRLAKKAIKVWESPPSMLEKVVADLVDSIKTKKADTYTVDDYEKLASGGPARLLFDAFSKEVLALDDNVTEECFKSYIAYKAETDVVDVIPQTKRLKLILNLSFHELEDPKGLARDVSNVGSLGNGDVEVFLKDSDDLPYIMELVRQAFEKQMSEEEVDA